MQILVLGGTRFTGRALVECLLDAGHRVTIGSRRPQAAPAGAATIAGERAHILDQLGDRVFEATIDFICYTADGPHQVYDAIDPGAYICVSSTWVPRLQAHRVPLLQATECYLAGKKGAEDAVANLRDAGHDATVLRLPVILGAGDHTARLDFYRRRLRRKQPLIVIDGGHNLAQITWKDDAARVIARWLERGDGARHRVWEALADDGAAVRTIIADIAAAEGVTPHLLTVSSTDLARELPSYLDDEPLWREAPVPRTRANLFDVTGIAPTPRGDWLAELAGTPPSAGIGAVPEAECRFLAAAHYA